MYCTHHRTHLGSLFTDKNNFAKNRDTQSPLFCKCLRKNENISNSRVRFMTDKKNPKKSRNTVTSKPFNEYPLPPFHAWTRYLHWGTNHALGAMCSTMLLVQDKNYGLWLCHGTVCTSELYLYKITRN